MGLLQKKLILSFSGALSIRHQAAAEVPPRTSASLLLFAMLRRLLYYYLFHSSCLIERDANTLSTANVRRTAKPLHLYVLFKKCK